MYSENIADFPSAFLALVKHLKAGFTSKTHKINNNLIELLISGIQWNYQLIPPLNSDLYD